MNKNIYSTPEPSFAAELRSVLDKRNILTAGTKRKVLDALDDHIVNDEDTKFAVIRKKIIGEIYTSEETYIKQLEMVINEFKRPAEKQNLAPMSVINSVFGNIESIYNINNELLVQLKQSKQNIVSAFLSTAPFFKLYSVYAYNYRNIINILQVLPKSYPKFHEFILQQECKPTISKLNSLLITPIQRIPRYILLLKELKNYTPETVVFYSELENAIKEISSIAVHIDSLVQEQENVSRMIVVQRCLINGKPNIVVPGRKLIKEGSVIKISKNSKGSSMRYLFLLNDMILYCKDWKEPDPLKCLKVLPLDKCSVNAILHKRNTFSLHCQSFALTLSCNCVDTTNKWVKIIEKTTNQYIEDLKSLKRKNSVRHRLYDTTLNKPSNINKFLSCSAIIKATKKRKAEDEITIQDSCLASPSKKIKGSCETTDVAQNDIENDVTSWEKTQPSALVRITENSKKCASSKKSCLKLAKQMFVDATNSVQRYLADGTSSILIPKCGGMSHNG